MHPGPSHPSLPSTSTLPLRLLPLASFLALSFLAAPPSTRAAAPVLEHLFPSGANPGATLEVTAAGKTDPWPVQTWVQGAGVQFVPSTNQGRFEVQIATNAPPGPRAVRWFNADGASDVRFFVVGHRPEVLEIEPNNLPASAQSIDALPVTLNGRLNKRGDVDAFTIPLRTGQTLDARLDAYTLMSKVDAVLRLLAPDGTQLAWNHDDATLDPRLLWRATRDGPVILQVFGFKYPADASIELTGGDGTVYRLHLDLHEAPLPLPAPVPSIAASNPPPDPPLLPLPIDLTATLPFDAQPQRVRVDLLKDQWLVLDIDARRLGSPLDAWLAIEDPQGRELTRNDDHEGSPDPHLEWRCPADGTYTIAVGSTSHRGGPAFSYRLRVQSAAPDFTASLPDSAFLLTAGATNELKIAITRLRGHTNELTAELRDLPSSVVASAGRAASGQAELRLELSASTNAPAFSGPFRVVLLETDTGREFVVPFRFISRGENNGVPQGFSHLILESLDQPWLTVKPVAPPAPPPSS